MNLMYHTNKCKLIGQKFIYDNKYKCSWSERSKGVFKQKYWVLQEDCRSGPP